MKYFTESLKKKIGITEEDNVEDIMRELSNAGVDVSIFSDPNIDMAEHNTEFPFNHL